MAAKKRAGRNELVNDYKMLDKMAKELVVHQKMIKQINRRIAKSVSADFRGGLVGNLDIVMSHMQKAAREIERAKKELKRI